jgi:hypothetical protein
MTATHDCSCPSCRLAAAGIPPGTPLTPEQYARIAPPVVSASVSVDVSGDADVKKAGRAVEDAQRELDEIDARWVDAVRELRADELAPRSPMLMGVGGAVVQEDPRAVHNRQHRRDDLQARVDELRAARDRAGREVAAARETLAVVTGRARERAYEVER